jgi:hypothetical protein
MHQLAVVLVPFDSERASIRPRVARDAALWARLDTLLFRYEQPQELAWGVDLARGFQFDWWRLTDYWRREVRSLMTKQGLRPSARPIPRFLAGNAVWSEDVGRVRLNPSAFPVAILTPHGEWIECPVLLLDFGNATVRVRKAEAAWQRTIRKLMHAYPGCLAIGVDYHC